MILPALLLSLAPQAPASPADLSWSDYDRDGDQDALVVLPDGTARLLRNEGGSGFADASATAGLEVLTGVGTGRFGDFDLDRAPDLLLAGPAGLRLLRQEVGGAFVDVTAGSGLEGLGAIHSAEWIDADGDGRPDLHLVDASGHRLWANLVAGVFEERALVPAPTVGVGAGVPSRSMASSPDAASVEPVSTGEQRRTGGGRAVASVPGTTITPTSVGQIAALGGATGICAGSLFDLGNGGCLRASSVPVLGKLYPLSNDWFVEAATGHVGIGTTAPAVRLQVDGGSNALPYGGGYLQLGPGSGANVGFDNDSIQARNNGAKSRLWLNGSGGDVYLGDQFSTLYSLGKIGLGTAAPDTPVHVATGPDVNASGGSGYLQLGSTAGTSMGLDNNEIQARNGASASLLYLNLNGGDIRLGNSSSAVSTAGDVGIGTFSPSTSLQVYTGSEVTEAAGTGYLEVGTSSSSLGLDRNEIQARSSGFPTFLFLNNHGGDVSLGDAQSEVYTYGTLGVGTSSPDVKIQVVGGTDAGLVGGGYVQTGSRTALNLVFDDNEIMARNNGSASTLSLNYEGGDVHLGNSTSDVYTYGDLGLGTSNPSARINVEESSTADLMRMRVSGDTEFIITNDGKVGIEHSVPNEKLDVGGNVRCIALIQTSDARYKREVRDLEQALETILALRGVSYEWDPEKFPNGDPGRKLGFLAQEVRAVLPEAVKEAEDGFLSVSYSAVTPVLVEAVSELHERLGRVERRLGLDGGQ